MAKDKSFYSTEFIESYVKGQCSPEESKAMAELLQTDVNLQDEVNFQKDLLTAIAESRRKDLKKMLQNTPIPANKPLLEKPLVQMAATFVGVLAMIALWTLNQPNKTIKTETKLKIEQVAPITKNEEKTNVQVSTQKIAPETISEKEKTTEKKILPKKSTENTEKNTPFTREIHYQYDGNTLLQLFGDFRYELIEKVDVGAGEKTYIYVQNQFYELIPTASDEIRNLKESIVTDKEQIKLLVERLVKK